MSTFWDNIGLVKMKLIKHDFGRSGKVPIKQRKRLSEIILWVGKEEGQQSYKSLQSVLT